MKSHDYVQQLSVFIENRPGRALTVLECLEQGGVNVRGFMISDTNDYGILRLVVDKPAAGLDLLNQAGYAVLSKPILVARLVDEPGNLSRLMAHLAAADVDITYSYSLISTFVAICVENIEDAWEPATAAGVDLVTLDELVKELA